MEKSPTTLLIVCAALIDRKGRILFQKRPPDKEHGGLWEFPGGKVESGETPPGALVRELNEELGVTVEEGALEPSAFAHSPASETTPAVVILLYRVFAWSGAPQAEPGAEIGWFTLAEAAGLAMPPLDIDLLPYLVDTREKVRG